MIRTRRKRHRLLKEKGARREGMAESSTIPWKDDKGALVSPTPVPRKVQSPCLSPIPCHHCQPRHQRHSLPLPSSSSLRSPMLPGLGRPVRQWRWLLRPMQPLWLVPFLFARRASICWLRGMSCAGKRRGCRVGVRESLASLLKGCNSMTPKRKPHRSLFAPGDPLPAAAAPLTPPSLCANGSPPSLLCRDGATATPAPLPFAFRGPFGAPAILLAATDCLTALIIAFRSFAVMAGPLGIAAPAAAPAFRTAAAGVMSSRGSAAPPRPPPLVTPRPPPFARPIAARGPVGGAAPAPVVVVVVDEAAGP